MLSGVRSGLSSGLNIPRVGAVNSRGNRGIYAAEPAPGYNAYFRSDSGITLDGSNNVSDWADLTGVYTMTQATASQRPSNPTGNLVSPITGIVPTVVSFDGSKVSSSDDLK